MLYSKVLGNNTIRETSQKSSMASYNLLIQGGYVKPSGNGFHVLLPLGLRVVRNIMEIIREELEDLGGQEVVLPITVPFSYFEKTARDTILEREMIVFKDRSGRKLVAAPSHIEPMVDLLKQSTNSKRDYPQFLFQFQRKIRDEVRVSGGIMRGIEFLMSDAYSFHRNFTDLNNFFPKMFQAYSRIFLKCHVPVVPAESAVGSLSGYKAYEFLFPSDRGRDTLLECSSCGYTANQDVAVGYKDYRTESPLPMEEVTTEGVRDSKQAAAFFKTDLSRIAKTLVYKTRDGFAVGVIRGDYEISLEKLSRFLMTPVIRLATPAELEQLGFNLGSMSPIGIESNEIPVAVDEAVANGNNFVIGSNKDDLYYTNVNFGRDFESDLVGDLSRLKEGDLCFQCGEKLDSRKAIELGNIFKLGDYYSRTMGLYYRDEKSNRCYPNMGSYGIGIERLMAAIAEANRDDKGILWPVTIAPYLFYIMGIGHALKVREAAFKLHEELGDSAILDDRHESPGVKFQDMDLLGIPYRIVLSSKTMEDGMVEFYERKSGKIWSVPIEKAVREAKRLSHRKVEL
ncbi:MAG: proline--tRNA ligase [Spirochaetales bacterium]|nr:proline--tRNA ligase [Spirochaetales bacterium]